MGSNLKIIIGKRIRAAREVAGMSREQLAEIIGRTPEALGNIERGASLPPLDTLSLVSEALNVPLNEFVRDESRSASKRDDLEMRAYALIRDLNDDDAELAVELLEALRRRAKKDA